MGDGILVSVAAYRPEPVDSQVEAANLLSQLSAWLEEHGWRVRNAHMMQDCEAFRVERNRGAR